jgi:fatty-acyl-CoA synthase
MDSDQLTLRMIADRARRSFGDREVISWMNGQAITHSYREIFRRTDRLAWALRSLGVRPGDRIATIAWNHHRHLELYLAVTLTGAVLHTVNLRLSPEQSLQIIRHAGDTVAFIDEDLDELAAEIRSRLPNVTIIHLGASQSNGLDYEQLLAEQPTIPFNYPELDEAMPAATCYSSATTGTPKGVVYSHRALVLHSMMSAMTDTWGISEADRILLVVPMFHVNAWGLPFTAMWMGATLVMPGARPDADRILDLLGAHRATFAAAVPTVWIDVVRQMRARRRRLPELRLVVSGGAPLPATLLRDADQLGIPMIHSYGMTEATPLVLVGQVRSDVADRTDLLDLRLRQGFVVPGLDYRIVDPDGVDVPWDGLSPGELWLRGPWVAEEYERDERSAEAFGDGWYRTGDVVTVERHGYLQVVDRAGDLIKSGGEWISSIELENALMDHPAVQFAAVIAVPDARWQERPQAYVVPSHSASAEELRAYLASRFPRFWIPDRIVTLDAMPMTSVGKFDKVALRRMADQ